MHRNRVLVSTFRGRHSNGVRFGEDGEVLIGSHVRIVQFILHRILSGCDGAAKLTKTNTSAVAISLSILRPLWLGEGKTEQVRSSPNQDT